MPLDRYLDGDPLENHPLFKSEEQARIEETLEGEPAADRAPSACLGPAREDGRGRRRRRARRSALDGASARLRLGRLTPVIPDDLCGSEPERAVTPEERLRRYAELAVRVGANVQPGQDVVVTCLVEHAEIARAIAREAYRAGASHVVVLYGDLHLRRAAIELGPEDELGWSAPYLLDWIKRWRRREPGAHLADRQSAPRAAR